MLESMQLLARLVSRRGHSGRAWFAPRSRKHTIGLADFMSKIFNE